MSDFLDSLRSPWVLLGLVGQAVFSLRFLIQWVQSERAGRSVVPDSFWYLSIIGAMLLLVYSLWRRDPVFILSNSMGFAIYARNLALRRRDTA
jgi:lipid-A-disaccharide synthase-like uncharacterized protein